MAKAKTKTTVVKFTTDIAKARTYAGRKATNVAVAALRKAAKSFAGTWHHIHVGGGRRVIVGFNSDGHQFAL